MVPNATADPAQSSLLSELGTCKSGQIRPSSVVTILAGLVALLFFASTAATLRPLFFLAIMCGFEFAAVSGLQMRVIQFASSVPAFASGVNLGGILTPATP